MLSSHEHVKIKSLSCPATENMAFQLLPAEPGDVPDLVRTFYAAFANDDLIHRLMCDVPPEIKREYDEEWYAAEFAKRDTHGVRFSKVVETESKYQSLNPRLCSIAFL